MGKQSWENAPEERGSTMQNGAEEESDVDSMMNGKRHRIANTDLDEVTVPIATRHFPDRLAMNCGHKPHKSCKMSFQSNLKSA